MSTPWNPEDLPPWMRIAQPGEDETTANAEPDGLDLTALVLDLRDQPHMARPVQQFLYDFSAHNAYDCDPRTFELGHYLNEVWPDGVPTTVYVSNTGHDPHAPSHLRDLLIRPACEGPLGMKPSVGGLTLGLQVYRRQGKLAVRRIEVTPHVPLRHFEVRVAAPLRWLDPDAYMDATDFDALGGLQFHRALTRERLEQWRRYLTWKEALIRANQISIPYAACRWEGDTVIAFLVHEDGLPDRKIVGTELGAAAVPTDDAEEEEEDDGRERRRQRRRRRDPEVTQLGEVEHVAPVNPRDPRDREEWGEQKLTAQHRLVRIRLDEETAEALHRRGPPVEGQLLSSIAGDLAPLQNQVSGVNRLNNNQGFSPRLADFVFSSTNASVPVEIPDLGPVPGARELNDGQRAAVAKALAAPDLCLIQGPPGTGKTTVIADICLRATSEGKRVLVASQTNLAVDNALARLADVPWVRPLRLGDPGKVDEEFRDFLADRVVDRWFATIADHCRVRMRDGQRDEADLAAREAAVGALRTAFMDHAAASTARDQARDGLREARRLRDHAARARDERRESVERLARRLEHLQALGRWASGGALPPEAISEPWPAVLPLPETLQDDVPPLVALDRHRMRLEGLQAVLACLDAAAAGGAADLVAAEELRSLREEKERLIDSDDDADMRRLRGINRRLKELQGSGWNSLTGALDRAARSAWPDGPPECIRLVVDALEPSNATADALRRCRELVTAELAVANECAEAIAQSEAAWNGLAQQTQDALVGGRAELDRLERGLTQAQKAVDVAHEEERRSEAEVRRARESWDEAWKRLWPDEPLRVPDNGDIERAAGLIAERRAALGARLKRAARWRGVQSEWVERLRKVTDSDREQLQALYVRNSNVVGMTCNEAGKRKTWQDPEFKPFDIVIVDEVSKATPPELILPLLLGQKAVLVGDHRQLPPMFRERDASFGEASEEGEIKKEDFEAFRRMVTASVFEELFEQAPEQLKAMLWTQYRMHPRIMDAVNQFYEGRLEAGPDRSALATARVHHLDVPGHAGGRVLAPDQHLLWIDSSKAPDGKPYWEEQRGSSKLNWLEIDVITALLVRLGNALAARGYGPTRTVEIERAEAGRRWDESLARAFPEMPPETLDDLFAERRVRVDGRAQKPDGVSRAGAVVEVRAQKEVGVITFYGAQLKELRAEIDRARAHEADAFAAMELRTNTVDRFQGMEKPIVLVSLVRAKKSGGLGQFVREFQRINVGLSRAQQLLVIVGAEETWKHAKVPLPPLDGGPPVEVPAYRNILELARQAGGRRLARQVLL